MSTVTHRCGPSLALLTDLYELTMAFGYWKSGLSRRQATFHLLFRRNPFGGGFAVACGLADVLDFLASFRFDASDLEYLASLTGNDGRPLFEPAFLDYLSELRLSCDVDAVPEGTIVFAQEPLLRVQGPVIACQLLETPLLTLLNFPTLIATKAARVCLAAQGEPVLEFGLRRAQGIDGGITASRAAYVGGCEGTSNVLAGKLFGIPVRGTHAHSWVMCFEDELAAFSAYADALPNNCVFLVDTYDSLQGVRHAVEVGKRLRERGHELVGIRLDSGDLAYLSGEARRILDDHGFPNAAIVGSNDLDEHLIQSLKQQGAPITVWGVGTRLATAYDEPALGGVYKLTAVRDDDGPWDYRVKVSEQAAKSTTPGVLQVRRFRDDEYFVADAIYDEQQGIREGLSLVDPLDPTRRKRVAAGTPHEDLLVPVVRQGQTVYQSPTLEETRRRAQAQLQCLHPSIKRFSNPHQYPVGLEPRLHRLKTKLVLAIRERETPAP